MDSYHQCRGCKKVFIMGDATASDVKIKNPCCEYEAPPSESYIPVRRNLWPSTGARALLEFVSTIDLNTFDNRRIAIVFLCSTLEAFLLELVYELLHHYTSSPLLAEKLLKRSEGKFKLSQLFDDLNKKKMQNILKANDMLSFWKDWEKLVTARNQIGHGKFFHTPAEEGVDVETEETRIITEVKQNTLRAFHFLVNGIDPKEVPRAANP